MSATENYFAIEKPLVDRVKAVLPDVQYVVTAEDAETAKEWRKAPKAAHVIYVGDEIGQGSAMQGGGGVQLTSQLWMVVLQVKHAGTVQNGAGARVVAGPLIWQLLQGLVDFLLVIASEDLGEVGFVGGHCGNSWGIRDASRARAGTILHFGGAYPHGGLRERAGNG